MDGKTDAVKVFEEARSALTGLAYRILGSRAEAEDVAQDCFLAWQAADRDAIARPRSWLLTVCSRKAIDVLRSARRSRTHYVGEWLPEPVRTDLFEAPQEDALALSDSVTTAFLLVLQRLPPKERAAFLLHDVFDMDYPDIADALAVSGPACRKLVSRARANVRQAGNTARQEIPDERQAALVAAFEQAVRTGETGSLAALLTADATLRADGGGKVVTIQHPLEGRDTVLSFIEETLSPVWRTAVFERAEVNAAPALIAYRDGSPFAVVTFGYGAGEAASDIFIMRNPDKLAGIGDRPYGAGTAASP